jgi:hypothetical protein
MRERSDTSHPFPLCLDTVRLYQVLVEEMASYIEAESV